MPNAADKTQAITDVVNRYIALVASGSAEDLVELYADDATVEDPVGGEVHIGRQAIQGSTRRPRTSNGNASWCRCGSPATRLRSSFG